MGKCLHISGPDMVSSGVERVNRVQMILFKKAEIWTVNCTLKLARTFSEGFLHDKLLVSFLWKACLSEWHIL